MQASQKVTLFDFIYWSQRNFILGTSRTNIYIRRLPIFQNRHSRFINSKQERLCAVWRSCNQETEMGGWLFCYHKGKLNSDRICNKLSTSVYWRYKGKHGEHGSVAKSGYAIPRGHIFHSSWFTDFRQQEVTPSRCVSSSQTALKDNYISMRSSRIATDVSLKTEACWNMRAFLRYFCVHFRA